MTEDTLSTSPYETRTVLELAAELRTLYQADPEVADYKVVMVTEGAPVTRLHIDHATGHLYLA